jgi:hypothetical protein
VNWSSVESALRSHIETQWALSNFTNFELVWENEPEPETDRYMGIYIEGTYSEKTIYGSVGKRSSIEAGIVFFHSFTPTGEGKSEAVGSVVAMADILQLQTIATFIDLEGSNPPSPVYSGRDELDRLIPSPQPRGNYYRVSGSVPFIVRSAI